MGTQLQVNIVTPEHTVLDCQADYVGVPGLEGDFGVLPQHVPMLAALRIGSLYYRVQDKAEYVFVSGGFLEVSNNHITILTEASELAKDIDVQRAERAKERAEARLSGKTDEKVDEARARAALTRAVTRLRVAQQ